MARVFPLDLFDLRFSVTISLVRFSRLLDFIEWKTDFRLRSDFSEVNSFWDCGMNDPRKRD